MNVGITGDKGFIGKSLISALKKRKKFKLFRFDRAKYDLFDADSLKSFVSNKDVIVHAAGTTRGSDESVISGNIVITHNLLSAMKKFKSKAKLIYLSSIHADTDSVYGISKKLTEIMLKSFSAEYKTPVTVLRLTNVFGEGCRPFYCSVVATFCYQTANMEELTVNKESRNKKINLIYIGDVVKIIAEESIIRRKNPFYFKRVCSKNEITIGNLAKLIQSFKNKPKLKSKFHKDLYKTYLFYKYGK